MVQEARSVWEGTHPDDHGTSLWEFEDLDDLLPYLQSEKQPEKQLSEKYIPKKENPKKRTEATSTTRKTTPSIPCQRGSVDENKNRTKPTTP